MSAQDGGFFSRMKASITDKMTPLVGEVRQMAKDTVAEFRTPVPLEDASLAECLDYMEAVGTYLGPRNTSNEYVGTPNGPVWPISTRVGLSPQIIALCRANLDINPDMVRAIIEPLLASARSMRLGH